MWTLLKWILMVSLAVAVGVPILKFGFDYLSQKFPNGVTQGIATYVDKA